MFFTLAWLGLLVPDDTLVQKAPAQYKFVHPLSSNVRYTPSLPWLACACEMPWLTIIFLL